METKLDGLVEKPYEETKEIEDVGDKLYNFKENLSETTFYNHFFVRNHLLNFFG